VRVIFDRMASWDLEAQTTLQARSLNRAGRSPSVRAVTLWAVAVASALVAAAAAQSAPERRLQSPQAFEIARAGSAIPDAGAVAKLTLPTGSWGGTYRTAGGESVAVFVSNAYPVDQTVGQRWADFLGALLHGSELSQMTLFLAQAGVVERLCGQDTVACYSARDNLVVAPADDPEASLSSEAVITHEYGHHVAAHRNNAPWAAIDHGTKRWASTVQVCAKARTGDLAPGAEDPVQYELNPGEGFAESYRVLNERKAGLPETPWQIVSDSLYPSAAALAALALDVTTPWEGQTVSTLSGRFTRATRTRTFTVATPLDGSLSLGVNPRSRLRLAVDVFAGNRRVVHATGVRRLSRGLTVCGQRSYRIRIRATAGNGAFSLAVAKP
jgi:hypothetical protein